MLYSILDGPFLDLSHCSILGRFGCSHLGHQYLHRFISVAFVLGQRLIGVSRCDN